MSRMKRWIREGKMSILYRVLLVIWDIVMINFCSFFAIYLRHDLNWERFIKSGIENGYMGYVQALIRLMPFTTIVTLIIFVAFRLYSSIWRFASTREIINILLASGCAGIAQFILVYANYYHMPRTYFVIFVIMLFLMSVLARFSYRLIRYFFSSGSHRGKGKNTMIIGAGEAGNMLIHELKTSIRLNTNICCIIDDSPNKKGMYIHGVKVVGSRDTIVENVKKYEIDEIIIAMPSASKKTIRGILDVCAKTRCELKIVPGVYQLVNGEAKVENVRRVEIEDLLGREQVNVNLDSIINYVKNKVVLVTGGGGSIGSELCRQIAANHPKMLIIFDIYENNAYDIQQELIRKYPNLHLEVLIGSVRNTSRVDRVFKDYHPDIVYHAAAHKHVPLMEDSPNEAIKNNVFGTYKVALAADKYHTGKFVLISTDKAVNPTNIMGASKRLCEMIVQGLNRRSQTDYVAVRFGNVLGSNGSVIPLFKQQIEEGGPVTVTHPDIIRYFMTIPEAVSLVIQAGAYAKGGEIFVLDMGEPVKINDVAKKLIQFSGHQLGVDMDIVYSGLRPGEKLYEEILMDEEGLTSTENELIHIGKPIDFDEDTFFEKLETLYKAAYQETDEMKQIVSEFVPTYHIRSEDKERDRKMLDERVHHFYENEIDSEMKL